MTRHHRFAALIAFLTVAIALAGCQMGPSVSGSFDRQYDVSSPIRLELNNVAGDISITGSADGKVHVHAMFASLEWASAALRNASTKFLPTLRSSSKATLSASVKNSLACITFPSLTPSRFPKKQPSAPQAFPDHKTLACAWSCAGRVGIRISSSARY